MGLSWGISTNTRVFSSWHKCSTKEDKSSSEIPPTSYSKNASGSVCTRRGHRGSPSSSSTTSTMAKLPQERVSCLRSRPPREEPRHSFDLGLGWSPSVVFPMSGIRTCRRTGRSSHARIHCPPPENQPPLIPTLAWSSSTYPLSMALSAGKRSTLHSVHWSKANEAQWWMGVGAGLTHVTSFSNVDNEEADRLILRS